MKKLIPLVFLFIFLFNTAGYFIVFNVVDYCAKQEIQQEINSGSLTQKLTQITLTKDQLADVQWNEEGKEMRYNGQMYDVVKSTKNSSSTTFYCIDDKKEESLFANLDDHINNHVISTKPLKNSKKLADLIIKLYYPSSKEIILSNSSTTQHFISYSKNYTSIIINKNAPPPEFV